MNWYDQSNWKIIIKLVGEKKTLLKTDPKKFVYCVVNSIWFVLEKISFLVGIIEKYIHLLHV